MPTRRTNLALPLLFALTCTALGARSQALAQGVPTSMSEAEAHARLPRADLSGLTAEQRAALVEIAGDSFDYAGCSSTLAACLRDGVKDRHAPRMVKLAAKLLQDGMPPTQIIYTLEQYYGGFAQAKRKKLRSDDCGAQGEAKAKVQLVEFSDYQCPHCAAAVKPLHEFIDASKGSARLCSKYFPLPGHPRSVPASCAAEYARSKGKFWEMNALLFDRQEMLEDSDLKNYARLVGLDPDAMLKEVYKPSNNQLLELVERHRKEGMEAGVRATPSVYFNGRLHLLPLRPDYLQHALEDELEWMGNGGAWSKE
jgi:protein-disulfide isomerase